MFFVIETMSTESDTPMCSLETVTPNPKSSCLLTAIFTDRVGELRAETYISTSTVTAFPRLLECTIECTIESENSSPSVENSITCDFH